MAKSKWNSVEAKLESVEVWASVGLSDNQIASNLGISRDTFYKYIKQHSDFSDALKRGREVACSKVENALYKRATGYKYKEQQVQKRKVEYIDKETGIKLTKEVIHIVEVEKKLPPDVAAQKFYLINRAKGRWAEAPNKDKINNEMLKLRKKELDLREW